MNELGNTPVQPVSSVLANHGDPGAEYAALAQGAALVDRSYRNVLRLSGKDPVGMLNAILTNDVPKDENRGAYAALLNPKGRIQTDLRVLKYGTDVLVDTEPEGAAAAKEILGRYAPFSRVEVEDSGWTVLGLYGPLAKGILNGLELAEHETAEVEVHEDGVAKGGDESTKVLAVGVAVPVHGYDLVGPADTLRVAREYFVRAGAVPVGFEAYETARIAAGVPRFGVDITPENFPAEAGILEHAVSFSKGCYPGQETVARMRYRGHPNRTLHRLAIEGSLPVPDAPIFQDEAQVGRITSVAPLPVDGESFALGYLSRKWDPAGTLRSGEPELRSLGAVS